jgi:glutamine synthetase
MGVYKLPYSADIRELVQEHHVRFLRLQFTDVFGRFKNFALPVTELDRVLSDQVVVDGSVFGLPEMQEKVYLRPDHNTFILFPWRPRDGAVARLICNGYTRTGAVFKGCSRGLLAELAAETGTPQQLAVGAAIDFFLFHVNERGRPILTPQDYAGLCDLTPLDMGENARRDMVNTLDEMGIEVSFSHHGGAPGKNRICLKTDVMAAMADKIVTSKFVIQSVAQRHGLYASFIPKPFKEHPGAGISLFLTLREEDRNLFVDENDLWGLSGTARAFAGGIIRRAGSLTALSCPSVMSYKRLYLNDRLAPVYAGLSLDDRTGMLAAAVTGDGLALEYWIPDATSNPYLVLSLLLKAGMEAVSEALDRGVLVVDEPSSDDRRQSRESLPRHLGAAIEALKGDAWAQASLGELIHGLYIQQKEREWNSFLAEIHPWEIERYLP